MILTFIIMFLGKRFNVRWMYKSISSSWTCKFISWIVVSLIQLLHYRVTYCKGTFSKTENGLSTLFLFGFFSLFTLFLRIVRVNIDVSSFLSYNTLKVFVYSRWLESDNTSYPIEIETLLLLCLIFCCRFWFRRLYKKWKHFLVKVILFLLYSLSLKNLISSELSVLL